MLPVLPLESVAIDANERTKRAYSLEVISKHLHFFLISCIFSTSVCTAKLRQCRYERRRHHIESSIHHLTFPSCPERVVKSDQSLVDHTLAVESNDADTNTSPDVWLYLKIQQWWR